MLEELLRLGMVCPLLLEAGAAVLLWGTMDALLLGTMDALLLGAVVLLERMLALLSGTCRASLELAIVSLPG